MEGTTWIIDKSKAAQILAKLLENEHPLIRRKFNRKMHIYLSYVKAVCDNISPDKIEFFLDLLKNDTIKSIEKSPTFNKKTKELGRNVIIAIHRNNITNYVRFKK